MKLYPGKRIYARIPIESEPDRRARRRREMKWELIGACLAGIGTAAVIVHLMGGFR